MANRLIIFTRFPTPGSTKTRLIPALGPEGAADLHREMTEHTVASLSPLAAEGVEVEVRYEGGDEDAMSSWLGEGLAYRVQGEGDLGQRMERAFRESFLSGAGKVVIVGSDCPELAAADLLEALVLLDDNPVVLGPATDGGYYLVALGRDTPDELYEALFSNIQWGTREVLWRTSSAVAAAGYDLGLLDEKADVDEEGDLTVWEQVKSRTEGGGRRAQEKTGLGGMFQWPFNGSPSGQDKNSDLGSQASDLDDRDAGCSITIIIPTLNEEERIGDLIDSLKGQDLEIVVADGGSADRTVEICGQKGARVVHSPPGRAAQMNNGASWAAGDILLFLHADTTLPDGWAYRVRNAISRGAVGGAFLFGTGMDGRAMNVIENGAHFRTIRLGIVFGDQAIFVRSEVFRNIGGFPDIPVMEDYELWKRLGRAGKREIIHRQVTTSARKWEKTGPWKTTAVNQLITWLYILGVGPEKLTRLYRRLM